MVKLNHISIGFFSPQKWEVKACSMWSDLGSLTFSLVSSQSMNEFPIMQGKIIIYHTQSHTSITYHMWTAAHALISSWNRLLLGNFKVVFKSTVLQSSKLLYIFCSIYWIKLYMVILKMKKIGQGFHASLKLLKLPTKWRTFSIPLKSLK